MTCRKAPQQKKESLLDFPLSSSGEQDRTADLRVMNPAL